MDDYLTITKWWTVITKKTFLSKIERKKNCRHFLKYKQLIRVRDFFVWWRLVVACVFCTRFWTGWNTFQQVNICYECIWWYKHQNDGWWYQSMFLFSHIFFRHDNIVLVLIYHEWHLHDISWTLDTLRRRTLK